MPTIHVHIKAEKNCLSFLPLLPSHSTAYEKKPGGWPDPQNEPPYPANSPYTESDPLTAPAPSTSTPVGYGAPPSVPPQYEAYYGPAGEGSYQNADAHVPQGIFIAPVQPANESDHLAYSIITMICCFLPLGIVALVFSIKVNVWLWQGGERGTGLKCREGKEEHPLRPYAAFSNGFGCNLDKAVGRPDILQDSNTAVVIYLAASVGNQLGHKLIINLP
uniref:Uncharacterized protein n=1 Tax=Salvator merianae TaxID=96440 RepID=A0A8D0BRV9_SALMN